jgi:hypothetical protein
LRRNYFGDSAHYGDRVSYGCECSRRPDAGFYWNSYGNAQYRPDLDTHARRRALLAGMRNDLANQHNERRGCNLYRARNTTGAGRSGDSDRHFRGGGDDIRFRNDHHRAKCQHFGLTIDGECRRRPDSGIYGDSYWDDQHGSYLDADAGWRGLYARMRDDCTGKHGQWRTCNLHGANDAAH